MSISEDGSRRDVRTPAPDPSVGDATDALPVRLDLRGPHAEAIRRWIESVVGWQPTDDSPHAMDAAVALCDVAAAEPAAPGGSGTAEPRPRAAVTDADGDGTGVLRTAARSRSGADLPRVVLVASDDDPVLAGIACRGAAGVVSWPDGRDRLPSVVSGLAAPTGGEDCASLSVGGAGGGVGTTTVAFAIAGLAAWGYGRALVTTPCADGAVAAAGGAVVDGAPAWAAGDPVPGVAGLRRLDLPGGDLDAPLEPGGAGFLVRDRGVDVDTDVLVVRRDRRGIGALTRTSAGLVVVTDAGPAPDRALREAAGGRRTIVVPWSARVARAGLAGRLPAGLPGTWLRRLAPVAEAWR